MHAQLMTRGFTRQNVFYSIPGTRKSGDPNTSCGNSLLNGLIHEALFRYLEVPLEDTRTIVLGDDSLCIIKTEHIHKIEKDEVSAFFSLYGLDAKPKLTSNKHEIEFCSKLFWPTDSGTVLGPKLGRVLKKMGWSLQPRRGLELYRHAKSVALNNIYSMYLLEPLKPIVEKILSLTPIISGRPKEYINFPLVKKHLPNDEAYAMFIERYDLTMQHVTDVFYSMMSNVISIPTCLVLPEYLREALQVDC
jgi:hypothetical protein